MKYDPAHTPTIETFGAIVIVSFWTVVSLMKVVSLRTVVSLIVVVTLLVLVQDTIQ